MSDPDLRDCGGKTGYNLFNRNVELSPTRIDLYLAVGIRGPHDGKFIAQFTAADGRSLASMSGTNPAAKKKRPVETLERKAPRQVPEMPVETTIIDVIEEPVLGVVVVTEYESVRPAASISPGGAPEAAKAAVLGRKNNKQSKGSIARCRGQSVQGDGRETVRPWQCTAAFCDSIGQWTKPLAR